jgi:hypothetical protein
MLRHHEHSVQSILATRMTGVPVEISHEPGVPAVSIGIL